jgi:hypothetical protein
VDKDDKIQTRSRFADWFSLILMLSLHNPILLCVAFLLLVPASRVELSARQSRKNLGYPNRVI